MRLGKYKNYSNSIFSPWDAWPLLLLVSLWLCALISDWSGWNPGSTFLRSIILGSFVRSPSCLFTFQNRDYNNFHFIIMMWTLSDMQLAYSTWSINIDNNIIFPTARIFYHLSLGSKIILCIIYFCLGSLAMSYNWLNILLPNILLTSLLKLSFLLLSRVVFSLNFLPKLWICLVWGFLWHSQYIYSTLNIVLKWHSVEDTLLNWISSIFSFNTGYVTKKLHVLS